MTNLLKTIYRNLKKHKVLSFINISGLILGMLSTLFILEYVIYERSYESHHDNADNIYRLAYDKYQDGKLLWQTACSFYPSGKYLKDRFAEVENYFTIQRNYNINLRRENQNGQIVTFNEEKAYYSTASIFDVLSIPLVKGTGDIDVVNRMVISEQAARKYFGNEDPIGKVLKLNQRDNYTVVGVFADLPTNTHLKTDFLFSLENAFTDRPQLRTNWLYDYYHTYVQLQDGIDHEWFGQKAFPVMIEENYKDYLESKNMTDNLYLQPIRDIHLKSNIEYETEPPGNNTAISILFVFSLFFLVIAWVNYINLSSARAIERAKEVGVKKVSGISKRQLSLQLISETILFNLFCFVLTIGLFFLLNPFFQDITHIGKFNLFYHRSFWVWVPLVFLIGAFLSGVYPAFVLTGINPVSILKGNYAKSSQGILFRKVLVSFQFVVSLALLIGTFITFSQVRYLAQKNTGVNCQSKLVIKAPIVNSDREQHFNSIKTLKDMILQYPGIEDFSFSSDVPGIEIERWFWGFRKGNDRSTGLSHFRIDADNNFVDFYDVKLLAGRTFNETDLSSERKMIINLKSLERLGFQSPEEAVNQLVVTGGNNECTIIGVVDDFHYKSIKVEPVPIVILNQDNAKQYMSLKVSPSAMNNFQQLLKTVKSDFDKVFPNQPFEYFMQEDLTAKTLKPDKTFAEVFALFSLQAIVIAVIGILGLIIVTINQTKKELGVRKVLGAEVSNIFIILSKTMIGEFIIAAIIALPGAYYLFEYYVLSNYNYRINLNWTYFVVPLGLLLLLFSALVFNQAIRANRNNVVTVLSEE